MSYRITKPGKRSLVLDTPVMNAAGALGFGDQYRDLLNIDRLGAFVTNPITYTPRSPANGTRVVPLDAGLLIHTGLPNPGLSKVLSTYRAVWERLNVPVIAHLVATTPDDMGRCVRATDREEVIAGIELGLSDEISAAEAMWYVKAARDIAEKPLIVRVPFGWSLDMTKAIIDGGADALVMCSAPRGTARDASGRLVAGRVYSPTIKPLILRMVGQLARRSNIPVIGAGGIHSAQDARDYLEAGAVAVQVDSAVWIAPKLIENISRELGGMSITQQFETPDDWNGE
ncbi:MAG: hypothetical protein IAE80_01370 [Anaerolinea sp.]|nr:hypothetical protein [Anaerolinea sp.]